MENKNFDEFIRAEVAAGEFKMAEKDWQKFETLLDEDTKKKRIFPWWLTSLIALLILSGSSLVISKIIGDKKVDSKNTAAQTDANNNSQNKAPLNSVKTAKKTILNTDTQTNNQQKTTSINSNNQTASSENIPNESNLYKRFNNNKSIQKDKLVKQNKIAKVTNDLQKNSSTNNHQPSKENANVKSTNMVSITPKIDSGHNNINQPFTSLNKKEKRALEKVRKAAEKEAKKILATALKSERIDKIEAGKNIQLQKLLAQQQIEEANKLASKYPAATTYPSGKILKIDTYAIAKPTAPNYTLDGVDTIYHPRYVAHPQFIPKQKKNKIDLTDSMQSIVKKIETPKKEPKLKKVFDENFIPKIWVLAHAGINANKGFTGNMADAQSFGLAPYINTGLYTTFSDRWSANAQFGFSYLNALNTQKSVNYIDYSFGRSQQKLTATYKSFTQLSLPINAQYQFAKNNFICFGFGFNYLLDVKTNIVDGKSNTNQYGYRTGFNTWDAFAQIGYAYQLNNLLQIVANYNYGLMDATKNLYFNNTIIDKQNKFSVGVKYNLKQIK